jgi:uncharacterized protein
VENFLLKFRILKMKLQDCRPESIILNRKLKIWIRVFQQKSRKSLIPNPLINKYREQQNNVRNNREYDSLSKEIEFQTLEIELCKKKIKEFNDQIKEKQDQLNQAVSLHEERNGDLTNKKNDLEEIVNETQRDIEELELKSEGIQKIIESRLLHAYKRIRSNARNGLAVVTIERDACGGCFNQIPPQRQMDIKSRKKIIVCEYCGRILVDEEIGKKKELIIYTPRSKYFIK